MNKKVAIFSDIHVGIHRNSILWHKITLDWVDWFVLQLESKGIKDVLFLGDFFDHRDEVAVNSLHVGYQILDKLKDFNIIMVPGNHDSFYRDHSDVNSLNIIKGWGNINLLIKTSQLMLGSKLATFVPWGGELSKSIKSDYMFGHLEINTFRMNGSKVCEKGLDTTNLLSISPKIFSGHFHLKDWRNYNPGYICYVGNPFEMNFGDAGSTKGIYILNLDNDTTEFITNDISPKHHKILISTVLNEDLTQYKKIITNNIIKLVVDVQTSAETIDKVQQNINLFKPMACTVDFLINIKDINVIDNAATDISGVNMEDSIINFINNLEIPNTKELAAECLEYYKKIK